VLEQDPVMGIAMIIVGILGYFGIAKPRAYLWRGERPKKRFEIYQRTVGRKISVGIILIGLFIVLKGLSG